jgi:hypothetical protein
MTKKIPQKVETRARSLKALSVSFKKTQTKSTTNAGGL